MKEDLNFDSSAYNWAITMFFIGYVWYGHFFFIRQENFFACEANPHLMMNSLQIPANYVITKVRPSIMLPAVVTLWGAVVCFMALVKNYQGMYGLRICLGFTEAVSIPAEMDQERERKTK